MLRQLFLKPLSATAVRSDPKDAAGPSTPGFDFGGASCGGARDALVFVPQLIAAITGKSGREKTNHPFVCNGRLDQMEPIVKRGRGHATSR